MISHSRSEFIKYFIPEENFLYEFIMSNIKDYLRAKHVANGQTIEGCLKEKALAFKGKYSRMEQANKLSAYYYERKALEVLLDGVLAEEFIFYGIKLNGSNLDFDASCNLLELDPNIAKNNLLNISREEIPNIISIKNKEE